MTCPLAQSSNPYWLNFLSDPELGITLTGDSPSVDLSPWWWFLASDTEQCALPKRQKDNDVFVSCPLLGQIILWQEWWNVTVSPGNQRPLSLFLDGLTWAITSTAFLFCFLFMYELKVLLNLYVFLSLVFKTDSTFVPFSSCYKPQWEWFHCPGSN